MGRRVLVTGSSRGIGRAIAERAARGGFDVVLHCREKIDLAEQAAEQIRAAGATASVLQFDIADREQCRTKLEADIAAHGAYYGVVHNAGIARDGLFAGFEDRDWDEVLRTDLDSFYSVLHPVLMPMLGAKQGGRIVTLTSVAGIIGNAGQVNYSAAKAGLIGASKALAKEVAKRKITVNCVAPGFIETDMVRELPLEDIRKLIPMGRLGKPEEVAALVAFLLSDDAAYISGEVISINGALV